MKHINSHINFDLIDYYATLLHKNCKLLSIAKKFILFLSSTLINEHIIRTQILLKKSRFVSFIFYRSKNIDKNNILYTI